MGSENNSQHYFFSIITEGKGAELGSGVELGLIIYWQHVKHQDLWSSYITGLQLWNELVLNWNSSSAQSHVFESKQDFVASIFTHLTQIQWTLTKWLSLCQVDYRLARIWICLFCLLALFSGEGAVLWISCYSHHWTKRTWADIIHELPSAKDSKMIAFPCTSP